MSTPADQAEAAGKLLTFLKDIPLWLLAGCAFAADVLLFIPAIKAELPPDYRPWLLVLGVLFNILALLRLFDICFAKVTALRNAKAARRTFHLSAAGIHNHWGTAKQTDDSVTTQISARFLVKNLTDAPLGLVMPRLIKPKINGQVIRAFIAVRPAGDSNYGTTAIDGYRIPPGGIAPASVEITIRGVSGHDPAKTLHVALGIRDDEGNEQRVKVALKGTTQEPADRPALPTERGFSITDPVEKEIVAVLQSEVGRYDKHGRERCGFGSLHIESAGRSITGFGNDVWSPDSPRNQLLAGNPENIQLHSDNLASLLHLYQGLSTEAERKKFVATLLARLDPGKGYLRVAYFIVCALWKTGHLTEALEKARSLPENEMKVFGLSNVLFMINGLLRYRYPDFTPQMLDQIESFVHDLKSEHTFAISEKIAAIRAARLLQPPLAQSP
jgi:hypothetical protein